MDMDKEKTLEKVKPKPSPTTKKPVGRPRGPSKGPGKSKSTVKGKAKKTTRKRTTPRKPNTIPQAPTTPAQKETPHKSTVSASITPTTNNFTNRHTQLENQHEPATNNATNLSTPPQESHEKIDQDETLKNSEKPPEDHTPNAKPLHNMNGTFKFVLENSINTPMTDNLSRSTFLIQKELCEPKLLQDDDSTVGQNNFTVTEYPNNIRTTMMYKLPPKSGDITEEDAPIFSIKKMNQMIKALTNKLPCKLGPWKMKDSTTRLKVDDLLTELPENVDFVETYVYDFNRFLALDKNGYVRLNFFYSDSTSLPEIEQVIAQFKIPRTQFLEKSHSNALVPKVIGTLTGSVEAMAHSRDFKDTFIHKFNLSTLGLWWGIPRQGKKSEYNSNKAVLHLEIDQKDFIKRKDIETFFNFTTSGIDNHFFGVPMLLTVPFHYFANDDEKANLALHSRKQVSLSKSIVSTTISGVGLNNWANGDKTSTLLRELMQVESITKKKIMKAKKPTTFFGRLFYAIIPNKDSKTITFHFTKANASEGRSVARGLPQFIRDHFHLEPAFFCTSTALTEAMEGDWTFETRKFLSAQEKLEIDRLDDMEEEVNAVPVEFISKDHQAALALDNDDYSAETRLTKGDAAPTPAIVLNSTADAQSEMTNSTRESKAKRYADAAVKEVANEYSGTILNMTADIDQKDDRIAQLEMMLNTMRNTTIHGTAESPIEMETENNIHGAEKLTTDMDKENDDDNNTSLNTEEDNTLLSFSDSSSESQDNISEDSNTDHIQEPENVTQIVKYTTREKRKLDLDEDSSVDDTSRSTRAKHSLTNIDGKPSSSEEAASL